MNKFEKQLEKWNNGILRGAQSKLARLLHVSTATVALWATGQRHPSKGYVAKMAQLFKLDMYDVTRLFEPTPTYSQTVSALSGLNETENINSHQSITPWASATPSVSLPIFIQLPPTYPNYTPMDVHGWWVMPPKSAQGAQFLFLLPTAADPEQLLFVRRSTSWEQGTFMLVQTQGKYQIAKVDIQQRKIVLFSTQNQILQIKKYKPIGIIVRKVVQPY